ncbi:hypothetical protein D3C80_1694360 [compost metagenome]
MISCESDFIQEQVKQHVLVPVSTKLIKRQMLSDYLTVNLSTSKTGISTFLAMSGMLMFSAFSATAFPHIGIHIPEFVPVSCNRISFHWWNKVMQSRRYWVCLLLYFRIIEVAGMFLLYSVVAGSLMGNHPIHFCLNCSIKSITLISNHPKLSALI